MFTFNKKVKSKKKNQKSEKIYPMFFCHKVIFFIFITYIFLVHHAYCASLLIIHKLIYAIYHCYLTSFFFFFFVNMGNFNCASKIKKRRYYLGRKVLKSKEVCVPTSEPSPYSHEKHQKIQSSW